MAIYRPAGHEKTNPIQTQLPGFSQIRLYLSASELVQQDSGATKEEQMVTVRFEAEGHQ